MELWVAALGDILLLLTNFLAGAFKSIKRCPNWIFKSSIKCILASQQAPLLVRLKVFWHPTSHSLCFPWFHRVNYYLDPTSHQALQDKIDILNEKIHDLNEGDGPKFCSLFSNIFWMPCEMSVLNDHFKRPEIWKKNQYWNDEYVEYEYNSINWWCEAVTEW